MAESSELQSGREGLPLEVEHRVDRLDLNPPRASFERLPNEARVVPWHDDELVAVLDVRILERNLAYMLLPSLSAHRGDDLLLVGADLGVPSC